MARPIPDMTGRQFGRLTVLQADRPRHPENRARWMCRCECGMEKSILHGDLIAGYTKSCGCWQREVNRTTHTKHGKYGSPEYIVWIHMIQRCEDTNHPAYWRYGGRGISVCARWRQSFMDFLTDVGPRPSPKHSLDRFPDKNGNYEASNVRWATWTEQANNRNPPTCQLLTWNGVSKTIAQWSRDTGIKTQTINHRLIANWPVERVLTQRVRAHKSRPAAHRHARLNGRDPDQHLDF